MLYVRFIKNFILNTTLTSLNEDGKYDIQEFSYPVKEEDFAYNIAGYSEDTPDSWSINFNGAGNFQGIAVGISKAYLEIHNTEGPSNPPPVIGPCCEG